MNEWIVELEPGVWLAPWSGDPGRTLVEATAKRYKERRNAVYALTRARRYRPFRCARIVEVRMHLTEVKA